MDRETESVLLLTAHALRFATNHPYAATGIFGAVVGSAVTYHVMKFNEGRAAVTNIFTPKVFKLELASAELRHLLEDPLAELRWDMPEMSIIISAEKVEPLKQLPVIEVQESGE